MLAKARLLIFVATTTDKGEAPDNARHFAQGRLAASADLAGEQVAVLSLSDRRYTQFCAFGRRIAAWAERSGADLLFPPIEVDDLDPAEIALWDERLSTAGFPVDAVPAAPAETRWNVVSREQVAGPAGCFATSTDPRRSLVANISQLTVALLPKHLYPHS